VRQGAGERLDRLLECRDGGDEASNGAAR